MSGIDPTQRLIAQIRAALSARPERQRGSTTPAAAPRSKDSLQQLSQDLRSAVRAIDFNGTDGPKRGRRAFVEVVLLDEFGVSLANDPRFPQMVEKVEAAIVDEDELRHELDNLLEQMAAS